MAKQWAAGGGGSGALAVRSAARTGTCERRGRERCEEGSRHLFGAEGGGGLLVVLVVSPSAARALPRSEAAALWEVARQAVSRLGGVAGRTAARFGPDAPASAASGATASSSQASASAQARRAPAWRQCHRRPRRGRQRWWTSGSWRLRAAGQMMGMMQVRRASAQTQLTSLPATRAGALSALRPRPCCA